MCVAGIIALTGKAMWSRFIKLMEL
ncbi:protein of unknown function [Candidatus Methylomirabilis oxygeniifera]|uniref:Uncharacterized protein n=1 Tax=Methylomirabilis oxygeniifera TaxID=671143 RepID=D5MIT4_METO1|nr:protein of unknown function [Candidatus Methylomirabilis oxyfera]